ncbi:MAG: serine/threonine protein kinase [Planctomycetia bacterium]|nr:serine/threonine protein kinase [Planctomycetia bacterium]
MQADTSKGSLGSIGNYTLLSKIAEGGMGWVYKGQNKETGQIVAIKIVPTPMLKNEVLLQRFENEWRAASSIDHPNIVRALDYCGTGSTPFLVMEYVDGESLGQKLDREKRINEAESIRIVGQVAQGLHRAHKLGMIHRDVKPDNIMIARDGTAKLTDLGLVKDLDAEMNLTKTGRGLGTPHFMAPEQFRNAKNADARCDIYSLAATLYQMVTGELPFGKTSGPLDAWMKKVHNDLANPRKLAPDLSERVDWAIRRAMAADPNLRPVSCREFIEDVTGHSTRKVATPTDSSASVQTADLWYLVYKDDDGTMHTVKGSTDGIRRSLKERLLGDASNVRACRQKSGPFEPLKIYPEFRDLVMSLTGATTPTPAPNTPPSKAGTQASTWAARPSPVANNRPATPNLTESKPPHIPLETRGSPALGWLMTLLLVLIGGATALVAIWLMSGNK